MALRILLIAAAALFISSCTSTSDPQRFEQGRISPQGKVPNQR